MHNLLSSAIME